MWLAAGAKAIVELGREVPIEKARRFEGRAAKTCGL